MAEDIRSIADDYVTRWAALDPIAATFAGVAGHDAQLTDYSPDGSPAALSELRQETLRRLSSLEPMTDGDRIAVDFMRERFELQEEMFEAGEYLRALSILGSPVQSIR